MFFRIFFSRRADSANCSSNKDVNRFILLSNGSPSFAYYMAWRQDCAQLPSGLATPLRAALFSFPLTPYKADVPLGLRRRRHERANRGYICARDYFMRSRHFTPLACRHFGNKRIHSFFSPISANHVSNSCTLGRLDLSSEGTMRVSVYSLTPMGVLVLRSAYSAMSRFLVLHRMIPMLG